jgi:hypothetical protein
MADSPFAYRALSDLFIGTVIVAPVVYVIDGVISRAVASRYLTLLGALRHISLPAPIIPFVLGLFWTLLIAASDNVGMTWN